LKNLRKPIGAQTREKSTKPPDWADEFDFNKAESLPELVLESVQRDDVYSEILRQARETRPKEKCEEDTDIEEPILRTKKPKGSRPASAKTSPLPPDILDLMFGPEEAIADIEQEAEKNKKCEALMSLQHSYPIILQLLGFNENLAYAISARPAIGAGYCFDLAVQAVTLFRCRAHQPQA